MLNTGNIKVVKLRFLFCFLKRDRKGVVLVGGEVVEELGGVEGGETIIRIYYMRKSILNIRKKNIHCDNLICKICLFVFFNVWVFL